MYISANLPPLYGRFLQIKEENYPFKHSFVSYLEAISRLGMAYDMDVDKTVGLIENTLLKDNRLPDIPRGDQPVKFRFTTDNMIVTEYFESSHLANKTAVLLIIRMTLRLSEVFGTSLTELIEHIDRDDSAIPVEEPMPIHIRKKPVVHPTTPVKEPEPVIEEEPELKQVEEPQAAKGKEEPDLMSRLSSLVERGEELLQEEKEDVPAGDDDGKEDEPVSVATNPLLSDFL